MSPTQAEAPPRPQRRVLHQTFEPLEQQDLFLRCPVDEVLFQGDRGGGKTDALLWDFAQDCGRGWGIYWRGVIFRRTYEELREVIIRSRKWFTQLPKHVRPKYNITDKTWTWPDGETLCFRFIARPEDYWLYHGHEYPWIGFEELCAWPDLKCYDTLRTLNRCSHAEIPLRIRANANPYGPGHNAVKMRFMIAPECYVQQLPVDLDEIELPEGVTLDASKMMMEMCHIRSTHKENVHIDRAAYIARLVANQPPHIVKAWLEGSWDIVAGGMIDDLWRRRVHLLPRFVVPESWNVYRAYDDGSTAPFSVGWWARSTDEPAYIGESRRYFAPGSFFRLGEWYGMTRGQPNQGVNMSPSQIAKGILLREGMFPWGSRVMPGPADPAMWGESDREGSDSVADIFERVGVSFVKASKGPGSRITGARLVREYLSNSIEHPKEKSGLYVVEETNPQWLRCNPTIQRDEKKPDDVLDHSEDHSWDETRYIVQTPVSGGEFIHT